MVNIENNFRFDMETNILINGNNSNGNHHLFDKDDEYNSAKVYFLNIVNSIIIAEGELMPRSLRTRNLEADFDELWSQYILMKKNKVSIYGINTNVDQNKENGRIYGVFSLPSSFHQHSNNNETESVLKKPFFCNNNTK
uniref:Uncharacterized protein n=1 Tax=Strongyloides stercoralis TaxID=6248 RepID=A0A0K0ELB5_STRER